jgi:DNA polymerase-3 subunit delta'
LKQIKNFAQKVFNIPNLPIDNNPDFCVVERDDTKSITIDQIRKLQSFLYSTSMVGEYKFAVIMEADLMNNNASNCCLKILEEPPRESYLFMLTKSPINLSATIRSRCHKIHIPSLQDTYHNESYKDFIDYLLDYNIDKRMNYLQSISTKAKLEEWVKFCNNSVRLLFQIMKHKSDSTVNLDKNEISYLTFICYKY